MKKIEINGRIFELRERKEVSKGACERVEELEDVLLSEYFDIMDLIKIDQDTNKQQVKGRNKKPTKEELIEEAIQKGALREGKTVKDLQTLTRKTENIKDTMAVMLTTNMHYNDLISDTFPQMTYIELVKESKKLIGEFEDFIIGLPLNMQFLQATPKPQRKPQRTKAP